MSEMCIGPGPGCSHCGGTYGSHRKDCPEPKRRAKLQSDADKALGRALRVAMEKGNDEAIGRALREALR